MLQRVLLRVADISTYQESFQRCQADFWKLRTQQARGQHKPIACCAHRCDQNYSLAFTALLILTGGASVRWMQTGRVVDVSFFVLFDVMAQIA